MSKRALLIFIIGSIALLDGSFLVLAQDRTRSVNKTDQQPVKYEAEEGIPKDKAGERRRDYAVLEAALNDITSPKNPENRTHIENVGPGREIIVHNETCSNEPIFIDTEHESRNIEGKDPRRIPIEIQEDFKHRLQDPPRSLRGFKPANPNILVRDLDRMFDKSADDPLGVFLKEYPSAWGYVWAYPPAYSKDGKSAFVVFEGGPNGIHGLDWKYMLVRNENRWIVLWRHCHPRE